MPFGVVAKYGGVEALCAYYFAVSSRTEALVNCGEAEKKVQEEAGVGVSSSITRLYIEMRVTS